ncbi:uncharacterized protein MYCFIDRAFT_213553 [Pseudocercospora fijiensis CIRAD86]|uniref:Uncharacterized protein n=1 Tax=Pseudocercospora fijiensis (strain CIRAD86) TaxID=383855 RepID=N1Q8H3_PSEFD|nr:uncharacterized protein MYCFIDRAFT_213553 [Pseudocercospora fijiensis CIRAD86]EME89164.1 hypothetical protein MYCFIDRAFT_213553 [Pseudocercospora fijiensis CIRAD86]
MRKLRDREVRVEGDKMVETVSPTHSPQPPSTPHSHHSDHALTCKVPACGLADHEFDHWESGYT